MVKITLPLCVHQKQFSMVMFLLSLQFCRLDFELDRARKIVSSDRVSGSKQMIVDDYTRYMLVVGD